MKRTRDLAVGEVEQPGRRGLDAEVAGDFTGQFRVGAAGERHQLLLAGRGDAGHASRAPSLVAASCPRRSVPGTRPARTLSAGTRPAGDLVSRVPIAGGQLPVSIDSPALFIPSAEPPASTLPPEKIGERPHHRARADIGPRHTDWMAVAPRTVSVPQLRPRADPGPAATAVRPSELGARPDLDVAGEALPWYRSRIVAGSTTVTPRPSRC